MRAAVISAGTNSCRLLMVRIGGDGLVVEHHDIRGTRLGERVKATGVLSPEAMERTLATIEEFAHLGRKTDKLFVIGTSALREAANAGEFSNRVAQITGTRVSILTGEEEARASFDGALWALESTGRAPLGALTVVDVGGGSTEIAWRPARSRDVMVRSLPLGAVRFTEQFFKHDPPRPEEITACRTAARLELTALPNDVVARSSNARSSRALVFVGGTADTAARMLHAYDLSAEIRVADVRLNDLEDLTRLVTSLPVEQRARLHGLPASRADIFPAGLAIIDEIAMHVEAKSLSVCESDLLVGYLRERLAG